MSVQEWWSFQQLAKITNSLSWHPRCSSTPPPPPPLSTKKRLELAGGDTGLFQVSISAMYVRDIQSPPPFAFTFAFTLTYISGMSFNPCLSCSYCYSYSCICSYWHFVLLPVVFITIAFSVRKAALCNLY